jgi:hypothetical protein
MADAIFWVTDKIVINLESVAYVHFDQGKARIVFASGEKLSVELEGQDAKRLFEAMRENYKLIKLGRSGERAGPGVG